MQVSRSKERPAGSRIGRTLFYAFTCCVLGLLPGSLDAQLQIEPALGTRRVLALRVSFPPEVPDEETTSGDGTFDLRPTETARSEYRFPFDLPPHDRTYFESHLEALSNYYRDVSGGRLELTYEVFPRQNDAGYVMDQPLIDFGNGRTRQEINERIVRLFRDALVTADASDPDLDFSEFDHVVVFHAGLGGESSNALNDVLSAFIDREDLETYAEGVLDLDGVTVSSGMLLPEAGSLDGRGGLNGQLARFYANQLGLPRLDNPEDGLPAVGDWSLMDTGNITLTSSARLGLSNLSGEPADTILVGFIPSRLLAWSRSALGWLDIPTVARDDTVRIAAPHIDDGTTHAIRVPINADEYFLIENRMSRLAVEGRTPTVILTPQGVWTSIDDYDAFIPGSGILIWHVDNAVIRASTSGRAVNSHPDFRLHFDGFAGIYRKGIDLEEADGLEDIGNASSSRVISSGVISFSSISGSAVDPYHVGNVSRFGPDTEPRSESNLGYPTGIQIEVLSAPGEVMEVAVRFQQQTDEWPVTDLAPDPETFPRAFSDPSDSAILRGSASGSAAWTPSGLAANLIFAATHPIAVGSLSGSTASFIYPTADGGGLQEAGQTRSVIAGPSSVAPSIVPFPILPTDLWGLQDGTVEWGRFAAGAGRATLSSGPISGMAVANSDPDIDNELAVLTESGRLFAVEGEETFHELAAFPVDVTGPVTADLDANGLDDIVVVSNEGTIFTAQHDGSLTESRPVDGGARSSPVVADIDRDGFVEVLFGGVDRIWIMRFNDVLQQDAPVALPLKDRVGAILAPPAVADLDADGNLDVLVATQGGLIYGMDNRGALLPGLPVATLGSVSASPLLEDIDRDGNLELVAFTIDGSVHLWHLEEIDPALTGTEVVWGQQGGDGGNSGHLAQTTPQPEPPDEASSLMPPDRVYCYPNPVRGNEAFFRFYLVEAADVNITVINPRGEVVERMVAPQTFALTDNEIRWDTSDYASGFFICRVEALTASQSDVRFVKVAIVR